MVSSMDEAYNVLGLSPTSSWSEIKSAYRGLALQYHPDKHSYSSPEVRLNYEEHMKKTTEAYSLLSKCFHFDLCQTAKGRHCRVNFVKYSLYTHIIFAEVGVVTANDKTGKN